MFTEGEQASGGELQRKRNALVKQQLQHGTPLVLSLQQTLQEEN